MAYLVRRLLENTSNESFLRQSFSEGFSREELLKNPATLVSGNGSGGTRAESEPVLTPARSGPQESVSTLAPLSPKPVAEQVPSFRNAPPLDWSQAQHRERFAAALKQVRERFPWSVPLVVGDREAVTGRTIRSTNPNRPEETIGVVASAHADDARGGIRSAKAAFPSWRDTEPRARAEYLFRAARAARKRRYELAALEVFEAGKSWSEADADVCEAIDFLEYYGREMIQLGRPRRMGHAPGEISQLFYDPRGVTAVIAPWNFPLAISMGMVSAAIVTGNTVIYKPSSATPVTGYMVSRLFQEVGLPTGVLNYLPGPGEEIGDLFVTHPDVAMIAFTGSKEVGLRIIRQAGQVSEDAVAVKRVVAEMGGKNAILVDSDADLDEAVVEVLHSAFGYQGQKCSACSRLIVLEEIHDKLVERLRSAAESLELGPVEEARSAMGAVISSRARQRIEEYISIGKDEGTLVIERRPDHAQGHFVPLTIFQDIRPEHRLAQDEIFGPVLSVMRAKDFDEALRIANSTEFALTGAVFSRSPENIAKAKKRFRVGNLYINRGCTGAIVERHPFGGFKMSGIGSKAGGPDYLRQFMVPRNVVENTIRRGFAPADDIAGIV
jgi:RHH-type proline utilization regulon transcriptional repressor/proline dehydrogenase/delta 1-pyrroline-5-carboxylate dehydrogenase